MTVTILINDRMKEIRLEKKLKHVDISEITGYSPNTVKKWFTDPESKYYQVAPIQALKLLEQWLIDGENIKATGGQCIEDKKLAEVWASMNHKGGVSKTTSILNFGLMLAKESSKADPSRKNKVLMVDCDSQQNLTKSLVTFPGDLKLSVSDIIKLASEEKDFEYKKEDVDYGLSIDLLCATSNMSSDIAGIEAHELVYILKESLVWFKEYYDYILIDGLPSKGSWYVSVLAAADKVIIPFTPNKFDVWGVADVFDHVKKLRLRGINKKLKIGAVFCSKIQRPFRVIDTAIIDEVKARYPNEFCPTLIRTSVKVYEGCDSTPPISVVDYAPESDVANEYREVLDFIKKSK